MLTTNKSFNELFKEGLTHFNRSNNKQASIFFLAALKKSSKEMSKEKEVNCYLQLFKTSYKEGDYQKSEEYIEQAHSLCAEIKNDFLYAQVLSNRGLLHKNMGQYKKATSSLLKAAEIFGQEGKKKELAITYNTLGGIFIRLTNYDKATQYHLTALKIRKKMKLKEAVAKSKNNLANVYLAQGKLVEAEKYIRGAIKGKKQAKASKISLASSYVILGTILKEKGQINKAFKYFKKSLKRRLQYNDKVGLSGAYLEIGEVWNIRGDYKKAITTLKKGLQLSEEMNFGSNALSYLFTLSRIYKKQGNYKKALESYERYDELRQKLITERLGQFVSEKQMEFDVKQKDRTIEAMEINIREFHHRVKNNFQFISSLLSSQYNQTQDDGMRNLIRETETRIQAMTYVHRSLYNKLDSSHIKMRSYLENLIENLVLSHGFMMEEVIGEMQIDNGSLHAQTAMQLGLIVNELVSNAFKHAFVNHPNPKLKVSLNLEKNDKIHLTVSDNGAGFNIEESRKDAFGVKLIKKLAVDLDGVGRFTNENGTKYELIVE
ncbi:MAG: tetratricopeptide repeat protein [Chitinophagales bacterium]